eukprot:2146351-Amphidinium_carterae.2
MRRTGDAHKLLVSVVVWKAVANLAHPEALGFRRPQGRQSGACAKPCESTNRLLTHSNADARETSLSAVSKLSRSLDAAKPAIVDVPDSELLCLGLVQWNPRPA